MSKAKTRAAKFLESLQATYGARRGQQRYDPEMGRHFVSLHGFEAVKAHLKQLTGKTYKSNSDLEAEIAHLFRSKISLDLPTPYEDPFGYRILHSLVEDIENSIEMLGHTIAELPLFGTLPTGRANAIAISVAPHNDKLVVFESGMFAFANLLAKAVARAFPVISKTEADGVQFSTSSKDIDRNIEQNPIVVERFAALLEAYLFEGHPAAAKPYLLESPFDRLATILRQGLELFVMGHEFAHILLGHVDQDGRQLHAISNNPEASEVIYNWQMEVEADTKGAELMFPAMQKQGFDIALSFAGATLFFSYVEIIHRGTSLIRTGKVVEEVFSKSHPPPQLRRELLRAALRRSLSADESASPLKFSEIVEQIVESLWKRTVPGLRKMYRERRKLALSWSEPL